MFSQPWGGSGAIQLGFDAAPPGTHSALAHQAEHALANLPDDFVVATTSEPATITCAALRAIVVEQVKAGGDLPVDVAASAGRNAVTIRGRGGDAGILRVVLPSMTFPRD